MSKFTIKFSVLTPKYCQGIQTEGEKLSTIDLLIKVAGFVTKLNNVFCTKKELI